jgi:hypothetical protein
MKFNFKEKLLTLAIITGIISIAGTVYLSDPSNNDNPLKLIFAITGLISGIYILINIKKI